MAKKTEAPAAPADEHHGHGGSYRLDESGKRVLVERTGPARRTDAEQPKDENKE